MRICKENGCNKKHKAKDYCNKHYQQIQNHGRILKRTRFDPNEIIIKGNVAEVVLYDKNGKERAMCIIDAEDVEKVKKYKWHLTDGYVATNLNQQTVGIQHIIMGVKAARTNQIDHKDCDKLNNRKSNFRFCIQSQNMSNRGKQKNNTSGFKGVYKNGKNWMAEIGARQNRVYLGTFKHKLDAAIAYNIACLKHHGKFACLNPIKGS